VSPRSSCVCWIGTVVSRNLFRTGFSLDAVVMANPPACAAPYWVRFLWYSAQAAGVGEGAPPDFTGSLVDDEVAVEVKRMWELSVLVPVACR
jgi:hypothetical protein